jgi:ribonuclease P protein component
VLTTIADIVAKPMQPSGPNRRWRPTISSTSKGAVRRRLSRSVHRGQGQADVPAEQPSSGAGSWLPSPDAYPCGSRHRLCASPQGPRHADCLTRLHASSDARVLPEPYRLHHHADFSRTVRRGQRTGRRDLVVHGFDCGADVSVSQLRSGGPRFGLIVSKSVGSAVVRHRVARRLRHICAEVRPGVSADVDVVIRALPGSAHASSDELARQLRSGLAKLRLLEPGVLT